MKRYSLKDHAKDVVELWKESKTLATLWVLIVMGWVWVPIWLIIR